MQNAKFQRREIDQIFSTAIDSVELPACVAVSRNGGKRDENEQNDE